MSYKSEQWAVCDNCLEEKRVELFSVECVECCLQCEDEQLKVDEEEAEYEAEQKQLERDIAETNFTLQAHNL
jgi:hypothetical protein